MLETTRRDLLLEKISYCLITIFRPEEKAKTTLLTTSLFVPVGRGSARGGPVGGGRAERGGRLRAGRGARRRRGGRRGGGAE